MLEQGKIQHFCVWINKNDKNKINRENYAVIDKKSSTWTPKIGEMRRAACKTQEERKKRYDDEDCRIYSDSFCEEWQEKCLVNFDKNMEFFKQISEEEFECAVEKVLKSRKNIRQIFDLNDCKGMRGIYIMVLDEYKQVYVGQSNDIKRRIMAHWTAKKEFDRLIFGGVNDSVLSIDSFGALDTTRIFAIETDSLDSSEKSVVSSIPPCFRLNRIGGGTISDNIDILIALGEWNHRALKDCHSEEYAEKYEQEMDVTHFISLGYCEVQTLSVGDVICVEELPKVANISLKYYGKILKINKTSLCMSQYCGPILGESCFSYECEFKDKRELISSYREFRIKKTLRFFKVDAIVKKETHTFWRSKRFPHIEA